MSEDLPPLLTSLITGATINGAHIDYWRERAERAELEAKALRSQDWDALKDHANRVLKAVASPAALTPHTRTPE